METEQPLFVRASVGEVSKLRLPLHRFLLLGSFRGLGGLSHRPDLSGLVEQVQRPAAGGKVGGVGVILPVPQLGLGVVHQQAPPLTLSLGGEVVVESICSSYPHAFRQPPQLTADALWQAAGVGHHSAPGQVKQHFPRRSQALATPLHHPQGLGAHDLEVGGHGAVDLVDVVFLEKDGVAQVGDAPGEVSRRAGVHGVGIGGQAVKHVPVEGVPQLGAVDGVVLTPPHPVLVFTHVVQVGDGTGEGHLSLLRVGLVPLLPVQGEGVLVKHQLVVLNVPDDEAFVVLGVGGTSGDGNGVPLLKVVRPGDPLGLDGVGLGLLPIEGAILEGQPRSLPGGLHGAEHPGLGVVVDLVGKDEQVGAQGGKGLLSLTHIPLSLPLIPKSTLSHPTQRPPGKEAPGLCQCGHLPPGWAAGQEGIVRPSEVLHLVHRTVPRSMGVVQATKGGLAGGGHADVIGHRWQSHYSSPPL